MWYWLVTLSFVLLVTVQLNNALLSPNVLEQGFHDKLKLNHEAKNIRIGYFTQWIDHFNSSDFSTFDQKIYINDEHYNLFGPVFIILTARLTEFDYWLTASYLAEINEQQFGVVYGIEPRFYGESRPTSDLSMDNLRLLSIEQTLEDLADFTRFLRLQLTQNKFILFGIGDGGALATFAHQAYPQLFNGVWAEAPPVKIKVDFQSYYYDIQETLLNYNRTCASIIGGGLEELDQLFELGEKDRIHDLFGFQNRIDFNNTNEINLIFYQIASLIASNLEYGTQNDLNRMCSELLGSSNNGVTAVESLAKYVYYFTQDRNPSWNDTIELLRQINWDTPVSESGERQYWYTACTERSLFTSSAYFPPPINSRFTEDFFFYFCYKIFEFSRDDIRYGNYLTSNKYELNTTLTNVIFTSGGLDPFRLVGQTTNLNKWSPAHVVPGVGKSYIALGYLSPDLLTPDMVAARENIRSHILSIINY